jgi:hypothetical protein
MCSVAFKTEVIKQSYAIRFCPKTDRAGVCECAVLDCKELGTIERYLEDTAGKVDA